MFPLATLLIVASSKVTAPAPSVVKIWFAVPSAVGKVYASLNSIVPSFCTLKAVVLVSRILKMSLVGAPLGSIKKSTNGVPEGEGTALL